MNYLGLNEKGMKETAKELNSLLADYEVYYQNLRNFHWNVTGSNFFELHNQFEALYTDANTKIDEIAERVLTLKYRPLSNFSEYLSRSDVEEAMKIESDTEMVSTVLKNHGTLIKKMRTVLDVAGKYNDEGTIDMIGSYISEMEKTSWMLNAWLQKVKDKSYA